MFGVQGRVDADLVGMSATLRRRPVLLCLLALAAPLALPSAPAAASGGACAGADLVPSAANVVQVRSATRCLINQERRAHGRGALSADRHLTSAAQRYSRQMVRDRFFDHVSPAGSTLLSRIRRTSGYLASASSYTLGENLAWGAGARSTPAQTVDAWMHSPGHRRNILDRAFRQVGVGVALGAPRDTGGAPAATYTTEFGRRS